MVGDRKNLTKKEFLRYIIELHAVSRTPEAMKKIEEEVRYYNAKLKLDLDKPIGEKKDVGKENSM